MNVKRGVVKKGLMTGLFLQLAIGPVFFYIINLSLQRTVFDGLLGVLAVTIVDLFYISLALFGIGKLLEKNKIKIVFVIISSITLIIFGGLMIMNGLNGTLTNATEINSLNIFSSFISTFLLTIFNPMTIIFYTSLFTAKAIEYIYF
ncbi:LysE family transporter [Candidatus Pacearchaeota archaeon]|nr:LysE family transporter [Candidatus Pacearchaeota archaeon]